MRETQQGGRGPRSRGEQGGARFNLLVFVALAAAVGYAAYNYVPVAYNAFLFKDFMQETVDKAAFPPGHSFGWVEKQLRDKAEELGLPEDAVYQVQNQNEHIAARVQWTQTVSLPGFAYDYEFDHTAKSRGAVSVR